MDGATRRAWARPAGIGPVWIHRVDGGQARRIDRSEDGRAARIGWSEGGQARRIGRVVAVTAWVFPEGRGGLRERLGLAAGAGTAHPETRFTARLPSSVEGLFFDASFAVVWARTGGGENANLEALVLRHLYEVARRVTATEPVTQAEAVQARLNVVLGVPTPVDGGQVTLVRARSTLTVDAACREQMRVYEEMAREAALERARRERDLERWRYLADVVFSDPALARMWWLDGHPERLPELARLDPIFERLVEIARAEADDRPDETPAGEGEPPGD